MISIVNLLMQHLVVSPTCWPLDNDNIMNKRSPSNMVITMTRRQDSNLPTSNSEEPEKLGSDELAK